MSLHKLLIATVQFTAGAADEEQVGTVLQSEINDTIEDGDHFLPMTLQLDGPSEVKVQEVELAAVNNPGNTHQVFKSAVSVSLDIINNELGPLGDGITVPSYLVRHGFQVTLVGDNSDGGNVKDVGIVVGVANQGGSDTAPPSFRQSPPLAAIDRLSRFSSMPADVVAKLRDRFGGLVEKG